MNGDFRIGPWLVEPTLNRISRNGASRHLEPKVMQVLVCLADAEGQVVSKQKLIDEVWKETFVTDDVLTRSISELRAAFGDDVRDSQVIQTIPKHGYRLLLKVKRQWEQAHRSESPKLRRWYTLAIFCGLVILAGTILYLLRGKTAQQQITSLAVMPLSNLSGDASQDFFAEGMTDQLITQLGKIGSLRVVSRTSAMRYRDQRKSVPEIARELNVDAVVEGAVLREGNRVRINANLIQASGDKHLWAQSYEGDVRDILALQAQIASTIAEQIRITLTPSERSLLSGAKVVNTEAYDAYLKGLAQVWTLPGTQKSIQYFEQAIKLQPDYADAHCGLARAYVKLGHLLALPPQEAFPKAKAAALKALELDDTVAEAHATLGAVKYLYDWDFAGAENEIKRAIALNPNSSIARDRYGEFLSVAARHDEAIAEARRVLQIDPLSSLATTRLAERLYQARRYDDAIQLARSLTVEDPNDYIAHLYLGLALEQKHSFPEATQELQRAADLSNNKIWIGFVAHAKAVSGDKAGARKILSEIELLANRGAASPWWPAMIYSDIGDKDRAFFWLEKAYQGREHDLVFSNVWPMFDSLHSDPRYENLVRRVGLLNARPEAGTN